MSQGKGSKRRPENTAITNKNWDEINWSKTTQKPTKKGKLNNDTTIK